MAMAKEEFIFFWLKKGFALPKKAGLIQLKKWKVHEAPLRQKNWDYGKENKKLGCSISS